MAQRTHMSHQDIPIVNVGTHSEPQSWYKDYFKLRVSGNQQMQKEAFLKLPLSNYNQQLLVNKATINSFSWQIYSQKGERE